MPDMLRPDGINQERRELFRLLEKIYRERGFDFRQYREGTLIRRLGRRLRARGVATYAEYARILSQDASEYEQLLDELTINVTSFFRDKLPFKALEELVLPKLIQKGRTQPGFLRIWSAGCATGQEPYSIAMLLREILGPAITRWKVTILGTDIDVKALNRAREGVFTQKEVENIRPVWLKKYFISENQNFWVRPMLKQLVTFKPHNLVSDRPFHNLDLVVCRNVLIYFTPALQMIVLQHFYEGLKEGGFLLLGTAEILTGEIKKLFYCMDPKAKLYQKQV